MEKYIGANKWKWVQLNKNEINSVQPPIKQNNPVYAYLEHVRKNKTNYLRVDCLENGGKVVKGSLIYKKILPKNETLRYFIFI